MKYQIAFVRYKYILDQINSRMVGNIKLPFFFNHHSQCFCTSTLKQFYLYNHLELDTCPYELFLNENYP
jgi:hypothetical protein